MSPTKLPRCYFTVTIDGMKHGTVIFELCADICPKTCENFLSLCTGEKGRGGVYGKPLTYKGSTFHRVVRNFMIQGGDFTHGTGVGGESIYGGVFADENFILKHDQKFLLSMANRGSNTNGSQFFITTAVCPHLDNSHVVFGHVVEGESIVETIENITVDEEHKPYSDIRIIDCGVVPGFGPAIPPPDLSNPNAIPMLGPVLPPEVVQQVNEAPKEEKKKKKKKDDSNLDSSSSESSDSSDSDSSDSDSESDSDELTKKLKKKKKKLNNIKKKLNKLAKKKKLKKSRAKKLKRVEEKLKKIDSMLNGKMMESESEESDKEKLKNSFLYRSSQSPPKKKKRKEKKEDKVLDESFFARRGKITGALLAPVSHLQGGGSAEYSQTGPMDNITNIVNRNKSNVGPGLGGLEKAKKLGVPKVTVPPVGSKPPVIKDLVTEKKESSKDKKKKSKKRSESNLDQLMNVLIEESSSDSPSESSSASSSEEEKKKKKKKPSTTKKPSKRSPKKEIVKEKSVSKETTHSRKSKSRKKSRSRSKETRKKSKSRSRSRSSSTSPKRSRSYRHEKRSHSRSHRRDRRQSSSSSSSDSSRSSSGERYSGMKRAPRGRGNYRGYNSRYPPRLPFNNTRDPRDTRNSYNQSNRYRGGYHGYYNHHNSSSHHTSHHNNHHSKSHRSRSRSRSPKRHHSSSSKLSEKNFVPRTVRKVTEDQYKYVRKEEEGKLDKSPKFHYQDDVDERKEVKPSTGLRSKWSDDEDPVRITDDKDKVAITLEERLGKQLHQQTKKTNGVEKPSLEKPDEPILSEYNSPKLTFG